MFTHILHTTLADKKTIKQQGYQSRMRKRNSLEVDNIVIIIYYYTQILEYIIRYLCAGFFPDMIPTENSDTK